MAFKRLQGEYKQSKLEPNYFYSIEPNEDNFFIWNILLIGPADTIFEGGIFKCQLTFPKEYPNKAPTFKFIDNLFHPNVYKNGHICISILHEGTDIYGYENNSERWSPLQNVNSILMSIISLLPEPNFESPANVDASILWKNNYNEYKKKIYKFISQNI